MSDFFLIHSNKKKINLDEIATDLSKNYNNSEIFKTSNDRFQSLLIYNSNRFSLQPIYLNKLQIYLWIHGDLILSKHLKNNFNSYRPNEELIKDLFEKKGFDVFKEFTGWFNAISYSEVSDEFEIINSRLGMLPLFYYVRNDIIILSSRVNIFYKVLDEIEIDRGAIIQQCLYNYSFSDRTHIKNVKYISSGSKIIISNGQISKEKYWTVQDELIDKPLGVKESTDLLDETLNSVIKKYTSLNEKISVSLTGGWDGRLILAYALKYKEKDKITLYSFGVENSPDVVIPAEISKKHQLNYLPILLDDNYLKSSFINYAEKTILCSDSSRSFKRAHYLYAMDILKDYSGTVMTGIGGSNLLKSTAYTPSNVFNKFVLALINNDNPEEEIESQYNLVRLNYKFLDDDFSFTDFADSFDIADFKYLYSIENLNERFCTYLVGEIERKYFGSEVSSYRHLIDNYSPFLDYEFLQQLFRTSFFGGYNNLKILPSFRNALLYSELINRNNNFLAKENTDRNIDLNNLWNPLKYINLFSNYFNKNSRVDKRADLYNTDFATHIFINEKNINFQENRSSSKLNNEFISNYISIAWYIKEMSNGKINLFKN